MLLLLEPGLQTITLVKDVLLIIHFRNGDLKWRSHSVRFTAGMAHHFAYNPPSGMTRGCRAVMLAAAV